MAQLTLILGGIRSGKSRWAEQLASPLTPVLYLATAQKIHPENPNQEADAEMIERIKQHQQRREHSYPEWTTVEEPWEIAEVIRRQGHSGCILVECLTLWITNLIVESSDRQGLSDQEIREAVRELAEVSQDVPARVIVVSNEVGGGIIPINSLSRRFVDVLGEANQQLAAAAEEVYGLWAGIPLRLKPR